MALLVTFKEAANATRALGLHMKGDDMKKQQAQKERSWTMQVRPPAGFPVPRPEMFHGPLGAAVESIQGYTEADPVGILGCLMAECSALIGRGPTLNVSGLNVSARLFIMLVGPTSEGRKGTAGDNARTIVTMSGIERPAGFLQRGFASGESVVESLATLDDRRAMFRQDEMAGLLVAMNREGSTLSAVIRDLWDGVTIAHTTVAGHKEVEDAHVSVLGHITPEELRERLRPVDYANGLANRFLTLAVHRRQMVAWTGSKSLDSICEAVAQKLGAAINEGRMEQTYDLTDDAFECWCDIYANAPTCSMLSARREPQLLRLALIYAVLDGSDSIDVCHLQAALAFWDYVVDSVAWAMPDIKGPTEPARTSDIRRIIEGAGEDGATCSDIGKAFSGHLDAKVRDAALKHLEEHGHVVRRSVKTSGRSRTEFVLASLVTDAEEAA